MIAVAILAVLVSGGGTLSLLGVRSTTGAGLAGGAFFLGSITLALWTHALLFLRIPVGLLSLLVLPVILAAAAVWKGDRTLLKVSWGPGSIAAIPALLAAVFAVVGGLSWPQLGSDGESFYALKALSIAHYGTIWNPDFTDPARIHPALRRPLLLPCVYADFFLLGGTTDHRLLRMWFALLFAGSLGLLYERVRPPLLWLGVFAWMPAWWRDTGGVFMGFADATLGVLFLVGLDAIRKGAKGLAVLSLSGAVLLKQDAWVFLLAVAVAIVLVRPAMLREAALPLLVPAILVAGWLALASGLPPSREFEVGQVAPANLAESLGRWPLALERLGSEIVKPKHWGLFWMVVLAGVLVKVRRLGREDALWLLVLLFQTLAYIAVWATYRRESLSSWMRVQEMRLLFHLAPLAWCWLGRRWDDASGEVPGRGPEPETA